MSTCPKCATSYPANVRFCTRDGAVLEDEAPAEAQHLGKVIAGKYRLDAYLSRGGMGSVYRATHLMLEKQVALKVIKPELVGSSEFVRRFQREARAATSLNHPNIVGVYDLGQADDGTLYIAMEFIDGPSLKDAIRNGGPMEPARIGRLMQQILSALGLAHRHHIVHRDLKPQNIMLATNRDGNEIAKLVDFGIAKTFDDRTQLTATGFAIGTPQYMAPEQASGTEVDGRSDLYSLGIILYEMLVAEVPFNDPSTPAILVKHLTEIPLRPSQRRTDLSVHRGLEDVAVRCLEKDPSKRFQTAEEVSEAVAAVTADSSAVAGASALPMGGALASMASTRTATPVVPAVGSAAAAAVPAPVVAIPPTPAPPAPDAVPPVLAVSPAPAAPTPPAPVMKTGRNSLALGVGALAIVALAGTGFAVQQFVGKSNSSQQQVSTLAADPTPPAKAPASTSPTANAVATDPAATTGASTQPTGTTAAEPPRDIATKQPAEPPRSVPTSASQIGTEATRRVVPQAALARRERPPSTVESPRASPTTMPAPAAPAATSAPVPRLAENPSVLLRCDGALEVCGAVRDAFSSALERERMSLTSSAPRADVYIVIAATAVDGQIQQQFGTTFVVRNYSITVELEAPRMESAPTAPASRNFSADLRVGRERINENARLVASDTVQRIREFWTRQRSAGL
jgi:predicted Ser/Thr protein kinase